MFPLSVSSGFKSNHEPQTSSHFGSSSPTLIILGGKYNPKYAGVNQKHVNSHLASSKPHSHRCTDDFNSLPIFKEIVVVVQLVSCCSPHTHFPTVFCPLSVFLYCHRWRERERHNGGTKQKVLKIPNLATSVLSNLTNRNSQDNSLSFHLQQHESLTNVLPCYDRGW